MENECSLISSRGILKSCDIHSLVPHSSIQVLYQYNMPLDSIDSATIYMCSSAVFANQALLKSLKHKYILVSGDSDTTCPIDMFRTTDEFEAFIATPNLVHWFSQNCAMNGHAKLTGIPIGLDYHTLLNTTNYWGKQAQPIDQERALMRTRDKAAPFWEREVKCYDNFTHTNPLASRRFAQDRIDAIAQIPAELVVGETGLVPRAQSWKTQTKYAFVISPLGNGLDCHRTWEALVLGCIVIVKTSPIDYLYEDLPVWIVKEWSDVSAESALNIIEIFKYRVWNMDRLTLRYWMDTIVRTNT